MKKKKKRKFLKEIYKLGREIIPVIIGILLALYINNYQENKRNESFVQTVLVSVTEEIKENANDLETQIMKHKMLLDSIDVHLDNPASSIGYIINASKGIGFVSIKNTAWRSFMNSKMGLLDFKLISILTDIDESKKNMYARMEKITELIFSRIESTDYEDKRLLLLLVENLLTIEENQLESHKEYLKLRKNK